MLVFPHWRPELPDDGCRAMRWAPAERFAPYIARPVVYRPPPPPPAQLSDEESSGGGGSSPEREAVSEWSEACGWRGCGVQCASVQRLSAHVARAHATPHHDGLFYCAWNTCTRPHRGFNARYKMLVHVRTHTNERPHTCTQCNKSFSRAENLKIHLRSHSGEKPYVCPYEGCGKAYSNSSDRFKHTRTHTVDKPYCCKVEGCNKRYTDPSSLRKHVKTYKHFPTKNTDEIIGDTSPARDISPTYTEIEFNSAYRAHNSYLSPPSAASPTVPVSFSSIASMAVSSSVDKYTPAVDRVTYIRPLPEQPMYPLRVPTYEMSYLEYTQMYEHAYRSYYSTGMDYQALRSSVCEKPYQYDDVIMKDSHLDGSDVVRYSQMPEDMPLNLKCTRKVSVTPIEDIIRRDLPLDLSIKS